MTEPRTITLGGREIDVPALPLRLNMQAYPLCRKLSNDGLLERVAAAKGAVDCTADEMADLAELAFLAAKAADPALERDAFDEMPITPPELLDSFFSIRYQTGGWVATTPEEEPDPAGEAPGADQPPT
jgi:hypothetical protein